jgi:peptidoglycan hydrolase CwlO-like protein
MARAEIRPNVVILDQFEGGASGEALAIASLIAGLEEAGNKVVAVVADNGAMIQLMIVKESTIDKANDPDLVKAVQKIVELEQSVEKAIATISELRNQVNDGEKTIAEQDTQIDERDGAIRTLKESLAKAYADIDALNKAIAENTGPTQSTPV